MIPITAISDPHIQARDPWAPEVNDATIGGTAPPAGSSTLYPVPWSPTARLFSIQGAPGKYSDVLFKPPVRPILPNGGNLAMSLAYMVDGNAAGSAQALELDVKLVIGGKLWNFSHQNNYAEGGMEQVTSMAGLHVDTGFKPGFLTPNVWHQYQFVYSFDESSGFGKFISIALDGVSVTPNEDVGAVATNWPDSVYVQVQLDTNSQGGQFSTAVDALTLFWW